MRAGSVERGPGQMGRHPGHGHVEEPAAALGQCRHHRGRGHQPCAGVGHRVGAEAGLALVPGGQPAGDGGVVTEADAIATGPDAPVSGDRHPHLGPVTHQGGGVDPELLQGRGAVMPR